MYPQRDLTRLSFHKQTLRRNIATHRDRCATAFVRVAQPIEWIDHVRALWSQVSPIARLVSLPLGVALTRAVFPRSSILRTLVRWGPLVLAVARVANSTTKAAAESGPGHR